MSTLEIQKEQLHYHINHIDDEKLLQKIMDLVNEQAPMKLSEELNRRILKAKQEIAEGKFKTNEQVKKEVREWLQKK